MTEVVITGAARTPTGAFNGSLGSVPAHDLGAVVIRAALERAGVEPARGVRGDPGPDAGRGQGQNPARQASINAGVPGVPAYGVNMLCGSGCAPWRWAIRRSRRRLRDRRRRRPGEHEPAPHAAHLRNGTKMGDVELVDTMIKDGLLDAFNGYHMGNDGREHRPEVADHPRASRTSSPSRSQNKAEAAQKAGRFKDEIDAGHHQGPQGRHRRRHGRIHPRTAPRSKGWPSCARPSTRTAR